MVRFEKCKIDEENSKCIQARESSQDKFVKLVEIHVDGKSKSELFLGDIRQFIHQVKVSSVNLNFPFSLIFTLSTVELVASTLHYIFAFSTALAMLNMLPIPYLDGQYVFQSLLEEKKEQHHGGDRKQNTSLLATIIGVAKYTSIVLLLTNIAIAFYKSVKMLNYG